MTVESQADKQRGGAVLIEFPADPWQVLQDEAAELTAAEGRRVTPTEVVRRLALARIRDRIAA